MFNRSTLVSLKKLFIFFALVTVQLLPKAAYSTDEPLLYPTLISVFDYGYRTVFRNPYTIESFQFLIINNSDYYLTSFKYKIKITEPNGKVIFTKVCKYESELPGFYDSRFGCLGGANGCKSQPITIFPDKPVKSKFQVSHQTHKVTIEVIDFKFDPIRTAEHISINYAPLFGHDPDTKIPYLSSEYKETTKRVYATIFKLNPNFMKTSDKRFMENKFNEWPKIEKWLKIYDAWIKQVPFNDF